MNTPPRILITGSSGLIGSEAVRFYDQMGARVLGIDNNMRASFFGPSGDTSANLNQLRTSTRNFEHRDFDIRDRQKVLQTIKEFRPTGIIHAAAQPSHDLAKDRPFDDFEVNAVGTLNLLEAARDNAAEAPFIFMSTNKVYGDSPNELPLLELPLRFEYSSPEDLHGVRETQRIDQSLHSLFGASKLAADIMVQEYGRYFGMPTVCFRAGCMTGSSQAGVELHGFLNYLVRTAVLDGEFTIFGYKGKQVRDQIHASDVIRAAEEFRKSPRCAEVYNIGGGRGNSASVLESIALVEDNLGRKLRVRYVEDNRIGDHLCYISDMRKFESHFPSWKLSYSLPLIVEKILESQFTIV